MPCAPLARSTLLARVQAAVDRKGLTVEQLAMRTGLHRKTIRRFLAGETFSLDTLERVEEALHIRVAGDEQSPVDSRAPIRAKVGHGDPPVTEDSRGPNRAKVGHRRVGPVIGWDQAAQQLGISRRTLQRYRRELGDREVPWWRSPDALAAWFDRLVSVERRDQP